MKKQFLTIALLLSANAFAINTKQSEEYNFMQYQKNGLGQSYLAQTSTENARQNPPDVGGQNGGVEMNAQLINAQQTVRSVAIPMFAAGVIEMASTQVNPTAKINEITHMINEITRNMKIWSPVFGQLSTAEATALNDFLTSTINSTFSSTVTLMHDFVTVTNNQQAAINTQINSLYSLLDIEYSFLNTHISPTESQNMATAVQSSITNALANIPAKIDLIELRSAMGKLVTQGVTSPKLKQEISQIINTDLPTIESYINALLTQMRSDLMKLSKKLEPKQAVKTLTLGEKIKTATKSNRK